VQLRRLIHIGNGQKFFAKILSSSQITYVEAEGVGFSRFRIRFHRKRTASTGSASLDRTVKSEIAIKKQISLVSVPDNPLTSA